jgi:hypothetical protein
MPKLLKDIVSKDKRLEGVKSSTVVPGSLGTKPGVDYDPKSAGDRAFVAKHRVEKHADRVGNKSDVYSATNVKTALKNSKEERHGMESPEDEKVYEHAVDEAWSKQEHIDYHKGRHERAVSSLMRSPKDDKMTNTADIEFNSRKALKKLGVVVKKPNHPSVHEASVCNMTKEGVSCPVHGKTDCTAVKVQKEDLAVPLLGSDDESAEMVKTQLKALANKAMHLMMSITDDIMIEPWVQAKIAVAKDNVSAVHDYMIYGDHDKEEEQTAPSDGGVSLTYGAPSSQFGDGRI